MSDGQYDETLNFGLKKPWPGADDDIWGDHWNQNADSIDALLATRSVAVFSSDTPPPNPLPGQLWFDTSNPQLYVWFVDPTSAQWVIATAYAGGLTSDAPSDGQLYGRRNGAWDVGSPTTDPFLPLVGGTLSGDLNIGTDTVSARLSLNGPTTDALRNIIWRSAGVARWVVGPDGSAEAAAVTAVTSAVVPSGSNVLPVASVASVASLMQIGGPGLTSTTYVISAEGTAPMSVTTTADVAAGSTVVPVNTTTGLVAAMAIAGSASLAPGSLVKGVGGTSGIVTTTTSAGSDPAFVGTNLPVVSLAGIAPGMLAGGAGIAIDTFATGTVTGPHQVEVTLSKDITAFIPGGTTVTFATAIVLSKPTTGVIPGGTTLTAGPALVISQNTTATIASGTLLTMYPNAGNTLNLDASNDAGLPWVIPMQVSRQTGVVNFNEGMSVNTPFVQQPSGLHSFQPIFITSSSWAGSAISADGSFFKFHRVNIASDAVDAGSAGVVGWHMHHSYGGPGWTGGRVAHAIELHQTPGSASPGGAGSGINSQRITLNLDVRAGENAGGTAPTVGQASGSLYSLATYSRLLAAGFQGFVTGATNYHELNSINLNIGAQAGTSVAVKHGINIAQLSDDAVQGSVEDAAIQFGAQAGSTAGWKNFLALGNVQGKYPGDPNGTLWGTYRSADPMPMREAYGLDWRDIAFSTAPIATPGFKVDGSGNVSSGALVITTTPGTTSIDAALVSVTNTAVASSGTNTWTAGMSVYDASRNHWLCTATDAVDGISAGHITGISAVPIGPAYVASPPSNPVAVTDQSGHQTATLTLTWSASPSPMALNASGGHVQVGTNVDRGYALDVKGITVIDDGVGVLPASMTGSGGNLLVAAADARAVGIGLAGWGIGAAAQICSWQANGTRAAPTKLTAGNPFLVITGNGYGATGYSGNRAFMIFQASESWTDAAQGSSIAFRTTPIGTTATAEIIRFGHNGNILIGTTTDSGDKLNVNGSLKINGGMIAGAPNTQTGAAYTVVSSDYCIIFNTTATHTLTLPGAGLQNGRILYLKNIAAFAINSAFPKIVPLAGGAASAAIMPATAGKFCVLQCDGTNWQIIAAN